jgi:DNA gyrase subunit A
LEGYLIALDNIDEVIEIIKKSKDESTAKNALIEKFKLTAIQAQAILDMQLKRLTGLEREKIEDELSLLKETIEYLQALLKDIKKILKVIKDELLYLKQKYGDERKTQIIKTKPGEITDEQLIENKEVIVVLTKEGYIKQVPRETFRVQNRGGKGVSGMETKESDNVYYITAAMTHDFMLFFTNFGRVFQTRVWDVPVGSRTSKGKAIINLISLKPEEKITSILTYSNKILEEKDKLFILMSTKKGVVKKTPFEEYANIRTNGIIAIKLEKDDQLLWAKLTDGLKNVILVNNTGKAIVFKEKEIRITGRASIGVKGMELEENQYVVAADVFSDEEFKKDILVVGERGIGKKTSLSSFKGQHRGGKGVKIASVDEKFGQVAFAQIINPEDSTVILTSSSGQIVKIPLNSIPSRSRTAKGVILMRFSQKTDRITSATFI